MPVFSSKKPEAPQPAFSSQPSEPVVHGSSQPSAISGRTLTLKGNIHSDDETTIDARVEGNITVKKKLTIGRNAVLQSEIDAFGVIIQGKVTGNIKARNLVEIVSGGHLQGNIQAPKVIIADGAYFEGNVDMKNRETTGSNPDSQAVADQVKESKEPPFAGKNTKK